MSLDCLWLRENWMSHALISSVSERLPSSHAVDGDVGFIEHCQVNVWVHLASAVPGEVGEHDVANVIGRGPGLLRSSRGTRVVYLC